MGKHFFGAVRSDASPYRGAFSVPIRSIKCSQCETKYVVWGQQDAPERDKEEVVAIMARIVEHSHPTHRPILIDDATLDELKARTHRKARSSAP